MNKKGFFGYGRCPHCEAFLKEKDIENNTCWSCKQKLEKNKKSGLHDFIEGMNLIIVKKDFKNGIIKLKFFIKNYDGEKSLIHMACNNLGVVLLELKNNEESEKYFKMALLFPTPDSETIETFKLSKSELRIKN